MNKKNTKISTVSMSKWYYVCSEPTCMKKFAKDYDDSLFLLNETKTPNDKYNLILGSLFSTHLYCMTCSHNHAHRVYYNIGNPQPYNVNFMRQTTLSTIF